MVSNIESERGRICDTILFALDLQFSVTAKVYPALYPFCIRNCVSVFKFVFDYGLIGREACLHESVT